MRFAYMDSQGNEVPIPSIDALALRIELGAIGADTELYDARADRWGPAHTHEIFHTLSRDAEEEGFIAPPPAMVTPIAGLESQSTFEAPSTSESPPAEGAAPEQEKSQESGSEELKADAGLDFSLPDSPLEEPAADGTADAGDAAPGGAGPELAPASPGEASGDGTGEAGGFDFGDFSGLIEEELSFATGPTAEDPPGSAEAPLDLAPPMDLASGAMDLAPPMDLAGGEMELAPPMDQAGGEMELESPMDFAGTDDTGSPDGGLELEQPLSDYTPEAPAARQEEGQDEGAMDFGDPTSTPAAGDSSETARGAGSDEGPSERKPRSRPSAPRRPQKSPVSMIVGAVVVLAGGAAGFFAWQTFLAPEVIETPGLPPVVIPDIPAELLPRMRDMAEAAVIDMVEDLRGRSAALDIPSEPQDAWLGGRYLGNASQFADIETFWLGIERFVDEVRSTDTQLFHDKYVEQVEATEFAADTAAMLIERADSGFVAAREGRLEAYGLMDDLINAALDLHTFLLDNEENITYQPASAGMSDPVLEAVPSTEALGDEMWSQMDGITDALARLGTLERVTRERLFAVLFDRIRRAGVQ